mgnify:CR=1 FL=1
MKKFIALLLATVCAVCLLVTAGCGKKGVKYDANNFLTAAEAKAQYGNEYRIVKETVQIKVFVPRGSMNPKYDDMKMRAFVNGLLNGAKNEIESKKA